MAVQPLAQSSGSRGAPVGCGASRVASGRDSLASYWFGGGKATPVAALRRQARLPVIPAGLWPAAVGSKAVLPPALLC
jgi:hypothetical protein